jgi:hypothetical protein
MSKIIHIHSVGKRESVCERECVCVPVRPSCEREDWLMNVRGAGRCGVGDALSVESVTMSFVDAKSCQELYARCT